MRVKNKILNFIIFEIIIFIRNIFKSFVLGFVFVSCLSVYY